MDWLRWILLLIGAAIVAAIWWTGYRRARERDETLFQRARRDSGDDAPDASADVGEPAGKGPVNEAPDAVPDLDIASFSPFPANPDAPDLEVQRDAPDRPAQETDSPAGTGPTEEPADRERADPVVDPGSAERARSARATSTGEGKWGNGEGEAGEERIESVFLVAAGGERLVGSRLQALFSRHGLRHGEMGIFHLHDAEGRVQFSVANLVEPGSFDPATMDTLSTPGIALFLRLPGPTSAEIAFDRMIRIARGMADELEARLLDRQQSTLTRQTEQHLRDEMRAWDHRNPRGRA